MLGGEGASRDVLGGLLSAFSIIGEEVVEAFAGPRAAAKGGIHADAAKNIAGANEEERIPSLRRRTGGGVGM